jgi:hypothetical protein
MRTTCARLGAGSARKERPDETGAGATRCCTPAAKGGAAAKAAEAEAEAGGAETRKLEAVGILELGGCR